ncbi:MAG: hypothetical protein ACRYG4_08980, partial [Janthinobacterium lividum]
MVLLAVGATWFGRRPLAEFSIRRYLAANGVPAQIRAEQVGGNTLVFDDVRLGPHDAPDLVARRITLTLGGTPLKTHVTAIRLDGTLLRIRLRDGGVSFGSLDRLIPAGRSTRFPAVAVTVVDGTTLIDTPAGALLGRIAAGGRLDRDFRATLRTIPASLQAAGCRGLAGPIAVVLTTAATDFAVRAGGGVDAAGCAAAATPRLDWTATLRAPISLARLTARVDARLAPLTAGPVAAGAPSRLRIDAAGPPDRLGGTWHLASAQVGVGRDVAATVAADGRFDWSKGSPVAVAGTLAAGRLATPSLAAALAMPPGLPAVVAALLDRAASATRTLDLRATFAAALGEQIAAHVTSADATGAGGARFRFAGDAAAGTAGQTATVGGRLAWSGGGLPGGHLDVAHLGPASAGWRGSGRLTLAPWRAGDGIIAVRGAGFDLAGGDLVTSGRVLLSSAFA